MKHRAGVCALLACLGLTGAGCSGYGDETEGGSGTPPLVLIKDVNAFLADYQQKFGSVPKTYEDLQALYEQSGKSWPPFPEGGSWVYFPHRARLIEVREERVNDYLKSHSRALQTSRYIHSARSAEEAIRTDRGVSIHMPGYLVTFERKGSQFYFTLEKEADGITAKRGNHTANQDFDISAENLIVAVPRKPGR